MGYKVGRYSDLVYVLQGYRTDIFIDLKTNELKVYRVDMDSPIYNDSMSNEQKRIVRKILKLYKKIPDNYERIDRLDRDEFFNIFDRKGDYNRLWGFINSKLGVEVGSIEHNRDMIHSLIHHYISKKIPKQYNMFIGSPLRQEVNKDIEKAVYKSNVEGIHVLKKEYKRHKRIVSKYGAQVGSWKV